MTEMVRRSGLLVPLFSCPRSDSWGIGDIGSIAPMTGWLKGAGQRVLQLLPLNEMANGQQSPYSAMSAMAIDPIYIDVPRVADFVAVGDEAALTDIEREQLRVLRIGRAVDYAAVRALKQRAFALAFARFLDERRAGSIRADAFAAFIADEAWWLDDYALFRAIHEREAHRAWTEWPAPLQARDALALAEAKRSLEREILFAQYLQWLADTQWREARAVARGNGVALFGDLPFMVDGDSADVWAHQDQFSLDRSVGVPPDAFSATGQDWGMPPYRWDVIAAKDFGWLRLRARRSAALFDGYRVDHLVGFYRTYSKPRSGGDASFDPAEQSAQVALGEQNMAVFRAPGAEIVAEDLGVVPDFVRESLARLHAPGFKIFRWEREWNVDGQPFRDPQQYPEVSVAATGTHDTEPMRTWWEQADAAERLAAIAVVQTAPIHGAPAQADSADLRSAEFTPALRDALLETLFASRSALLLLPIQDAFGWHDRINVPATVTPDNWTFRLPWPVDAMADNAEACERQATLRAWCVRHHR